VSTLQKLGMGVIVVAAITTAILPNRNTVSVINAASGFTQGTLGTAMGTK
jgi:hypothetical protein